MTKKVLAAQRLHEAFSAFITGKGAERTQLELRLDGKDVTEDFVRSLKALDFRPTTVGDVGALPGERIPAFFIKDSVAYFGWVFWEKFTDTKMRKLWGSTVRNQKGDWVIQLPPNKPTVIYANLNMKTLMDLDRPW